ncbi:hypothetical protein [Noviherbaspirillum soli]|uniref:hypothetical protein n=1 Tax=Noviherbaspirillum soli TaxID=1064518 RepID=UPI00188CFCE0|nr:hypothetical protein [Noviherbaspirillum soli]
MAFSAEIIHIKDHNEDHEVGGLDLPVAVTLATEPQHTAVAFEMVEAGLGAFSSIGAFNVRAPSSGTIQFATFGHVALGQRITWNHSVEIERIIIEAQAKIENVIERSTLLALREAKSWRCNDVDPAALLPPVLDRKGAVVQFGDWCRFSIPETGRRGIGWIISLNCHPIRPIGVRPLNERLIGAIGACPAEIEILSNFRI